ncbi:hypothetical protein MJH12_02910, partial [bacterium]|nr:hypothetical protein [bacterium]
TLSDGSTVEVDVFTIGGRDVSATFGKDQGLAFSDVDFALTIFSPTDITDKRSWVIGKGSMGGASFLDFDNLSLSASSLELDVNMGLGTGNSLVVDLSKDAISVEDSTGTLAVFDESGENGERISISGSADISFGDIGVSGDFWFSKDNKTIEVAGKNIDAILKSGSLELGIKDGTLGLVLNDAGVAMQSSGTIVIEGLGFETPSADSVSVKYNTTNTDFTNHQITIGDNSYKFGALEASNNLAEVSVTGLNVNLFDSLQISGDYGFKKTGNQLNVIGQNASVLLNVGAYNAGVNNASVGMVINNDKIALEASGAASLNLGSAVSLTSDKVTVKYNDSGLSFTNQTISTADLNYKFNDLAASSSLQEVKIENGELKVSDFFTLSGNFAITKENVKLNLSDNTQVETKRLMLSGSNLSAFAGIGISGSDATGFQLQNVNFVLSLASEDGGEQRKWTSLKADTGSATFVGFTGVTASATNLLVEINTASDDGLVIDYSTSPVLVDFGSSSSISLDINGDSGELISVSGDLDLAVNDFLMNKWRFFRPVDGWERGLS